MTAPSKQENKADRTAQHTDVRELQDRLINLRDQEREVQLEAAERRELEALEASLRERRHADEQRHERDEAYGVIDRQSREAARQVEDGTRYVARGVALSASALIPPVFRQPTLLVDLVFNGAIAALAFQRDVLNELLVAGATPVVR